MWPFIENSEQLGLNGWARLVKLLIQFNFKLT